MLFVSQMCIFVFPFEDARPLYIGSRPLGMGNAFTALADDAEAGFWNPAGLVQWQGVKVSASAKVLDRENYAFDSKCVAYSYRDTAFFWGNKIALRVDSSDGGSTSVERDMGDFPHSSRGMGDFPHSSRGMGDFPHSSRGMGDFPHSSRGMGDFPHSSRGMGDSPHSSRGMGDSPHSDTPDFTYYSFARKLTPYMAMGSSVKFRRKHPCDYYQFFGHSPGYDFGILWKPTARSSGGMLIQNMANGKQWISIATFGFAHRFCNRSLLSVDIAALFGPRVRGDRIALEPHAGWEWQALRWMLLRVGMSDGDPTAGVGLKLSNFRIDYAWIRNAGGNAHFLSGQVGL
jgi:hypothetical protein